MEEANVRQSPVPANISQNGRRTSVSSDQQRRLLAAVAATAQKGNMSALEGLFAEDPVSCSDGGGIMRAAASQFLAAGVWRLYNCATSPLAYTTYRRLFAPRLKTH